MQPDCIIARYDITNIVMIRVIAGKRVCMGVCADRSASLRIAPYRSPAGRILVFSSRCVAIIVSPEGHHRRGGGGTMSDEGQRAQQTTAELDRIVIGRQPDRSELDEAIAWRDRFIAWQTDRMRGDACTEEQIEAMARKALDMPYAFWIRAMPRGPAV